MDARLIPHPVTPGVARSSPVHSAKNIVYINDLGTFWCLFFLEWMLRFWNKAGVLSQRNQRLSVLNTLGGYSPRPMVCFGSWELLMRRATVYHLEVVNTPNGRADEQRR